jgi:hypothetical protein
MTIAQNPYKLPLSSELVLFIERQCESASCKSTDRFTEGVIYNTYKFKRDMA